MKIKSGFVKSKIGDECVVVPVGAKTVDFRGIITLNDSAEFIWDSLKEGKTEEELLKLILCEYDVDEALAKKDLDEFISVLKDKDLLDL